jgi:hypothetical protein
MERGKNNTKNTKYINIEKENIGKVRMRNNKKFYYDENNEDNFDIDLYIKYKYYDLQIKN